MAGSDAEIPNILHMSVDPLPTMHPSGEMWASSGHPISPDWRYFSRCRSVVVIFWKWRDWPLSQNDAAQVHHIVDDASVLLPVRLTRLVVAGGFHDRGCQLAHHGGLVRQLQLRCRLPLHIRPGPGQRLLRVGPVLAYPAGPLRRYQS